MIRAATLASLALALAGCERPATSQQPTPAPATRADLRGVVKERIAALETQLPSAELPPPDAELEERVRGLLQTLSGTDERLKRPARDELREIGPVCVPVLSKLLFDADESLELCIIATHALGELDHPLAARALLERIDAGRLKKDTQPLLRAHSAWRLAEGTQDWVVPQLLLCLRYEADNETVLYLARTLAHFRVFSGLDALYVVSREDPRPQMRERALSTLTEIAAGAGFDDPAELYAAWKRGDERLAEGPFSAARELEVWRVIRLFGEWQLRPVDDGRFVLSLEHAKVTPLLVAALDDENRYVRVHAAQCLERLGDRARGAGPRLLELIDEPQISDQVLLCLGALRYAPAEAALIERCGAKWPLEVRMTATRALGSLGRGSSEPALRALLAERTPLDLRAAVLASIVGCAPLGVTLDEARELREHMTAGRVDSALPEIALEAWLTARVDQPTMKSALEAWLAIRDSDSRRRVTARASALDAVLAP